MKKIVSVCVQMGKFGMRDEEVQLRGSSCILFTRYFAKD